MPFGLTNTLATFQHLKDHIKRLEAIFQKLHQAHLKLSPSKCHFFQEIKYLGHMISEAGVSDDPEKVASVKDWKCNASLASPLSIDDF